jgi:hypothetical protein
MLTDKQMLEIANKYIQELEQQTNMELEIPKDFVRKSYGNIYDYVGKNRRLAGNAPFLVEKLTGKIVVFGTSEDDSYYIREYEAGRWPKISMKKS